MKWVHREICNSRTYQLSWQPNETNAKDERNFARSRAAPTAGRSGRRCACSMAIVSGREGRRPTPTSIEGPGDRRRRRQRRPRPTRQRTTRNGFALQVFGRSIRESNCDCDRSMEASLLQTVFLQNDSAVLQAIEQDKDSWIAQISKQGPASLPMAAMLEARSSASWSG